MPDELVPAPEPVATEPAAPVEAAPAVPAAEGAASPASAPAAPAAPETAPAPPPAPAGPLPPLKRRVEALLFAADAPLTPARIKDVLESDAAEVRAALDELAAEYDSLGLAFGLQAIGGGYVLSTRPEYGTWVGLLKKSRDEGRLSPAALETLAIVAYRQPINRVNIEAIRGVQSGALIRALMDKDLVRVVGKEDLPGHPVLYGTTPRFLEVLGLNSLSDLPKPEELK